MDQDEDGHPDQFYSQDITDAQDEYRRTCLRAQFAAVIVDCLQPSKTINSYNLIDCNDNDDSVWTTAIWYTDEDNDGAYGTYNSGCQTPPADSSPTKNDCDDTDDTVKSERTFYRDADLDGIPGTPVTACSQGSYFTSGGDCNDNDDTIKSASLWYLDGDKDGVGGPTSVSACTDPSNSSMSYLTTSGDECDNDPSKTKKNIWYFDFDGDTFGDSNKTQYSCNKPDGD